ncbi:hypothetical protein L218DRAFT_992556 [Marasmius fiardii PR-910]|nr:hypothetical protein L218DRAFT_992556 [Marasmius fiardii PR-910]
MVSFIRSLSTLLAVLYATCSNAAALPAPCTNVKHSTHHVRVLTNGVKLQVFHPESNYKTFEEGLDIPSSFWMGGIESSIILFVALQLNLNSGKVLFKSGYTTEDGKTFGYAMQVHPSPEWDSLYECCCQFCVQKITKSLLSGNLLLALAAKIVDSKPSVDIASTISKTEAALQGKKNEIEPTLIYFALQDGSCTLVHVFQVQNDKAETWYEAYVDAHSRELLSITDFVAHASYHIPYFLIHHPLDGMLFLAPLTISSGNNVFSFRGVEMDNTTKQSSDGLVFDYIYDPMVESDNSTPAPCTPKSAVECS